MPPSLTVFSVNFRRKQPDDTLSLNPHTTSIAATGGNLDFNVTSNTGWNWSDNAAWIICSQAIPGSTCEDSRMVSKGWLHL